MIETKKEYHKVGKVQEAKTPEAPKPEPIKSVVLTTDGKIVRINPSNVSFLEIEMMLIKSLEFIRDGK